MFQLAEEWKYMGTCGGKKKLQVATEKSTSQETGGRNTLSDLRKLYDEENHYMNRKVKSYYEVALSGDTSTTLDINMKFINLGESGAMHLSKVLPFFINLKSLRLWKTKLGVDGAKLLATALPKMKQLEVLSLEDNEIKAEGVSYIAKTLPALPVLHELYLHVNKMGQEGISALSTTFSSKTDLRVLTVDENQISKNGLGILLASLTQTRKTITLLGLAFNMLGNDGARLLFPVIKEMPELKKLTLAGNNLSPEVEEELKAMAPNVDFLF